VYTVSYCFAQCACVFWSASLVPVFSFGENDLFHQVDNPAGSALRRFQESFKKVAGFTPPVFYGPGILNCFLPFRKPLHTIGYLTLLCIVIYTVCVCRLQICTSVRILFSGHDLIELFVIRVGQPDPRALHDVICWVFATAVCNGMYKQVVKVIWHKAAAPPHMDGSVVFFRWPQCAPHI